MTPEETLEELGKAKFDGSRKEEENGAQFERDPLWSVIRRASIISKQFGGGIFFFFASTRGSTFERENTQKKGFYNNYE